MRLAIPDVILLEPRVFADERGAFFESYNARTFEEATGLKPDFVQDNHSMSSRRGILRGLHFQRPPHMQDKLVRVVRGAVFDVAVDIRAGSPTYGRWAGAELSAENWRQLLVPAGFAHGFVALSETVEFLYKVTDYYAPLGERTVLWNDPTLAIAWPIAPADAIVSGKDQQGAPLATAEVFA